MQFQVPQFIDIEDKIIGPLTIRQFLYLAVAGVLSFICFFAFETWLWIVVTAIVGIIACVFAFIKYNGQPMPKVFLAALSYLWLPKLYIWKHQAPAVPAQTTQEPVSATSARNNPLKSLWFKMNTQSAAIPARERTLPPVQKPPSAPRT